MAPTGIVIDICKKKSFVSDTEGGTRKRSNTRSNDYANFIDRKLQLRYQIQSNLCTTATLGPEKLGCYAEGLSKKDQW